MEILETFFYFPNVFKKKYFEDNLKKNMIFVCVCFFSSPGHRPCELLSWVSVCRSSVRPLAFQI